MAAEKTRPGADGLSRKKETDGTFGIIVKVNLFFACFSPRQAVQYDFLGTPRALHEVHFRQGH